ncbi:hypothetical protein BOSEA31B_15030 [Hyphomicrobiales bacterium]|nr:hypothetical protein BOSEA31B_15030 [Hyphomicrobiales bacterium]CAH1701518.1 hypothetical protein BOSEA1005_21217 [Hyphomicrobiales bacterium]CAI0345475.1 hypothetical protein BO1005MUT1_390147 [Hyphomicrobiales bacterium]
MVMAACDLMEVVPPSSRASDRKGEIAFAVRALPASSGNAVEPEVGRVARVRWLHDVAREAELAKRAIVQHCEATLRAQSGGVTLPEREQAVQKGRAAGSLQRRRMGGAGHDVILSEAGAAARFVSMNLGQTGRGDKAEDCYLP